MRCSNMPISMAMLWVSRLSEEHTLCRRGRSGRRKLGKALIPSGRRKSRSHLHDNPVSAENTPSARSLTLENRKPATDTSYNGSIKTILSTLSSQLSSSDRSKALSVVFGTHNPESVDLIIQGLKDNGLAEVGSNGRLRMRDDVKGKVGIAQLYG